ncbi:uncharacterized protein THITE_48161 [Thermothielavioides terrestris NRRL 8126]|uniref:Uncharacterized protein n=1 Tax=Thermothielavioides terrestris (strain ATCC 38088 / NRRL 8126) TaxID=578455 RepID=G2QTN2_THETT|nr:uncharacterized protein THITE_48161 [Thermothielavioides terrestris NRRL 8126]AEO64451.1 hypothetical protein THITE_48161 [Thermothielavioides terrestris NRRL 8126]
MGDNERVDFEWLADLSKGQAFTTCGLSRPAKSLDFGADGFTASLTDTHELLQLTRPDATCGLVFLRGGFPDRADSILSRAQRGDDSDTFGTKLLRPEPRSDYPDVELGERKAQGWLNFRWPYAQYELVRRHPEKRDIILGTGTCEIVSFVSDGTVFQIHRLKWGRGSSVNDQDDSDAANSATARFRVGGRVRFGCPCAQAADGPADEDRFATASSGLALCCTSGRYKTTLVLGVQVHGAPQPLAARHMDGNASGISSRRRWIDLSSEYRVKIPFGDHEGVCLVSSYALRAAAEDPQALLTVPGSAPLPDRLQDYLGVDRQSVNMTDRLWTALCSANYEAGEAVELCVVGRCVEQILGVTSIPLQKPRQPSNQEGHELPELALIGNIMTFQYVDVESAFYQIRLLAKTHYFIKSRRLERDFVDEVHYRDLNQIKEEYLKNIRSALGRALTWLFRTDLKPGRLLLAVYSKPVEGAAGNPVFASCARGRVQLTWDGSYNRGCYATMAAWYVYRLCPEAITDRLAKEVLIPLLPQAYTEGMQRADRVKQPSPKANVLQWLHFSCILLLYHELGCEENADHPKHRIDLDVSEVRETQERFEKAVSRLKTSQSDGWSAEHDELDRVILLAEEMALDRLRDNTKSHSLAVSRARQTRRRIRNRRRTAKFHLGPKPWMAARSLSNGPWELQCIHHEASLRVADESNVIAARDRLFEFLLSDYSFMASWDRADAGMIGTWWDIQPVAMVSSTLLDLKVDGKLQAAKSTAPISAPPVDEDSAADGMSKSIGDLRTGSNNLDGVDVDPATRKTLDAGQVALISALTRQLKQSMDELIQAGAGAAGDGMASKAFEWVSQRPPSIYHPVIASPCSVHPVQVFCH